MQLTLRSLDIRIEQEEADLAESPDLVLVRQAQADLRAFAPLYERYSPIVYHYCLRRLSHPEAAADATSLIFTRAIAALSRFRPDPRREGSTFRSWLFTIAHNVIVDEHRRARPTVSLNESPDGEGPGTNLISTLTSPEEHAILADASSRVQEWLGHLPERQRAIVELRLAGLSGQEIAQTMGMSVSAVKSAQFRAYTTLRTIIPGDQR